MTQQGFAFVGNRCTNCKTCMLACKDYNDLDGKTNYRKVYEYGGGTCRIVDGRLKDSTFTYHISLSCNHCSDPACAQVCPTGAMHKDEQTGLVSVDAERCIGCGYCEMACPYDSPHVDREKGHSVKCDGCIERVQEGKRPICVEACPMRALDFGDIDQMRAKHGTIDAIAPMPSASLTRPNITIVKPAGAREQGSHDGKIQNLKEVM